jgi:hypothetical protein
MAVFYLVKLEQQVPNFDVEGNRNSGLLGVLIIPRFIRNFQFYRETVINFYRETVILVYQDISFLSSFE